MSKTETSGSSSPPYLPAGWRRNVVLRKSGISAGRSDVYYYSPEGLRFRSKPQLQHHFGDQLDLTDFDFRTGEILSSNASLRRRRNHGQPQKAVKPTPQNRTAPTRVICGLVRQPVTCVLPQSHDFRKSTPANLTDRFAGQTLKPVPQQRSYEKALKDKKVYDASNKEVKSDTSNTQSKQAKSAEQPTGHTPTQTITIPSGRQPGSSTASQVMLRQIQQMSGLMQAQAAQSQSLRGARSSGSAMYGGWPGQYQYQGGGGGGVSVRGGGPMAPPPQLIGPMQSPGGSTEDMSGEEIDKAEESLKRQEEKVRLIREKIEEARKRLQETSVH